MKKEHLLKEALNNVRDDRGTTQKLLIELQSEIKGQETTNAKSGVVAAKYVETLQRSNEQLVKILALLQKAESARQNLDLSDDERDNIFEIIQKEAAES